MDHVIITRALTLAESAQWTDARSLLQSQESGIEWSDDAPPSALLAQDGLLISACLACNEARMFPGDKTFARRAILLIREILGDPQAEGERAALEHNEAAIAMTELGEDL